MRILERAERERETKKLRKESRGGRKEGGRVKERENGRKREEEGRS